MSCSTVYETSRQNRLIVLKNIFEQNNVRYRILEESSKIDFSVGVKVQVHENDVKRAEALMRENGFLKDPLPETNEISMTKFWVWFIIALLFIVVAALFINRLRAEF